MSDVRVKTPEGTFIAASQRADGSVRRARRVKEGYVPQEEIGKYVIPAKRGQVATGISPRVMAAMVRPLDQNRVVIQRTFKGIQKEPLRQMEMNRMEDRINEISRKVPDSVKQRRTEADERSPIFKKEQLEEESNGSESTSPNHSTKPTSSSEVDELTALFSRNSIN